MSPLKRNFALGILHETLWGCSFSLINPATMLPLALKDLGGGAEQAGLLVALLFGGLASLQLFSAFYFSPRWSDPKWLALMHLPGISCVALMAALFWFFPNMEQSTKLAWFLVFSSGFFVLIGLVVPHWITMITRIIHEGSRGRYFGWSFSFSNFIGIAAGFYGTRWIAQGGMKWGYALCFGSAVPLMLLAVSVLFFVKPMEPRAPEPGKFTPFIKDQWAYISGSPEVLMFLALFTLMQLSSASGGLFTVCLKERGIETSWFGIFNAALNSGGLLGALLMGHLADAKSPRHGIQWAFAILALSLIFLMLPLSPAWSSISYFGSGFFGSAYPVLNLYLMTKLARPGRSTEFSGTFATITVPMIVLAPLFHGWLAEKFSYTMSYSISILACLAGLYALRLLPSFGAKTVTHEAR